MVKVPAALLPERLCPVRQIQYRGDRPPGVVYGALKTDYLPRVRYGNILFPYYGRCLPQIKDNRLHPVIVNYQQVTGFGMSVSKVNKHIRRFIGRKRNTFCPHKTQGIGIPGIILLKWGR